MADIRAELGLSAAAAGLLTTGPLLCLGILAPLGPRIARRFPVERIIALALLCTALGTAARGLGGIAPLYLGTLLAGAAIALTQVVTPAWVRAKTDQGAGILTGLFSTALVAGATIATFTAIPFDDALGGWEPSLAIWALPALIGFAVWVPLALRARDPVEATVGHPLWRNAHRVVDRAADGPAVDGVLQHDLVAAGDPRRRRDERGLRGLPVRGDAARADGAGVRDPAPGRAPEHPARPAAGDRRHGAASACSA